MIRHNVMALCGVLASMRLINDTEQADLLNQNIFGLDELTFDLLVSYKGRVSCNVVPWWYSTGELG